MVKVDIKDGENAMKIALKGMTKSTKGMTKSTKGEEKEGKRERMRKVKGE
ncbi:MAG: hypothetical protein IJ604_02460 [Prevotella sp.]|nr:hypothetical protein [Prevotella sp.]